MKSNRSEYQRRRAFIIIIKEVGRKSVPILEVTERIVHTTSQLKKLVERISKYIKSSARCNLLISFF